MREVQWSGDASSLRTPGAGDVHIERSTRVKRTGGAQCADWQSDVSDDDEDETNFHQAAAPTIDTTAPRRHE